VSSEWKSGSQEKILLVDDERYVVDSLRELLILEGYKVDTAVSGAEGITKLEASKLNGNSYDLVLTDLVMPPLDGMCVLEKAREIDPGIIVILMTGYATIESAVQSIRNGAYEYLLKPFLIPDLMLTIERGLEKRRLYQENRRLIDNLKEKNSELEHTLKKLKSTQSQLIDMVQKQTVNETVSSLKHEIINPLTTILTRVQLILEQNTTSQPDEFVSYMKIIQDQSVRISSIVTNLDKNVNHHNGSCNDKKSNS
jgi:DNA-binding response OmpR family regulator